jgi:hypothetical protein
VALHQQSNEIVEMLLSHGASIEASTADKYYPLAVAAQHANIGEETESEKEKITTDDI